MNSIANPYTPVRCVIRKIVPMSQDNFLFEFKTPENVNFNCLPGQFFELWIPGVGECPISVCSARNSHTIQLTVRKVGRVTSALFDMSEGDWVGLRGPYGVGFPVEHYRGQNLCLIAGGLGIAPIRSLLEYVLDNRDDFGKLSLIYGMRHSTDLLFRQEMLQLMRRRDIEVFIAAEDVEGPALPPVAVQLGRVTDMIRLSQVDESYQIAVCGPPVMYRFVIEDLKKKNVSTEKIWLSLERHMKCGIGKCGHCFIGGKLTCKSGPVFPLADLRLACEVVECAGEN